MDYLNNTIVYWHWIVLGLSLIILELFVPIFVTLRMGVAAIIVGILISFVDIAVSGQLIIWALVSSILVLLWHKTISPRLLDKTTAGLSREAMVGQIGLVVSAQHEPSRGHLRFPAPILGNDEWEFICENSVNQGDKVQVIDISGNSLLVKPAN